jgi:plasmid stabilization system protein ParE
VTVRYLRRARHELDEQIGFIKAQNPAAAATLLAEVDAVLEYMATSGFELGSEQTLRRTSRCVRRWVVEPLLVFYVRRPWGLLVVRVRQGHQRPITE